MRAFFARHEWELISRTHRHRFAYLVNGSARVFPITFERGPRNFQTENSAKFSTERGDSVAISGARKSQYWHVNARFFVNAGRDMQQIETGWRMMHSAANLSPRQIP
jgi:hypothetical protein